MAGLERYMKGIKMQQNEAQPHTLTDLIMAPSSSATTPGSSFPSNNSKLAPPPVEMWLITSATPTFSTAATESPPPIIVVTPFLLSSANFFAIAYGRGIDPWQGLQPIVGSILKPIDGAKSWLPESLRKKETPNQGRTISNPTSGLSLAEYLASSFNEASNESNET